MPNIIDYIRWRGDLSTRAVPFTAPDLAVAAALAYAPFELLPEDGRAGSTLGVLLDQLPPEPSGLQSTPHWKEDHVELWRIAATHPRFADWTLRGCLSIFEDNEVDELDQQFFACTFACDDAAIVAFRGTDSTVVGWREDFTMSYEDQVPAQLEARDYLAQALTRYPRVFVCGHSKGGNLALFAAASVSDSSRIVGVYNFDGPGLVDEVLASPGWAAIKDRTWNYVPESSVFGRIYNRGVERIPVQSESVSIMQHNIFNWQVEGPEFLRAEGLSASSDMVAQSLQEFVDGTPKEIRKAAVYGLFKVIKATDARKVDELVRAITVKLPTIAKTVDLTEDETAGLKALASIFTKNAGSTAKDAALEAVGNLGESISEGLSAAVDAAKQSALVEGIQAKLAQLGETLHGTGCNVEDTEDGAEPDAGEKAVGKADADADEKDPTAPGSATE